jgi:hypothetical protein
MAEAKTGLTLPLPLQFLAAWLAVWLGRVLQEQVDFLKAENRLLREKVGSNRGNHQGIDNALIVANEVMIGTGKVVRRDRLGGLLGFYHREAAQARDA